MIRLLSRLHRKPLTPESARDELAAAMDKAVKGGLHGFCLAALFQPGKGDTQVTVSCTGDITESLAEVLHLLLADPVLKTATMAIIKALQESGMARTVQMGQVMGCGDPDCLFCGMGGEMEGSGKGNVTTH